jgi:tryptophanyl-tRNA synthetase
LPGLDGRNLSKIYDNTIPLFAPRGELKKLIFSIVTDSRMPGEAKEAEGSALFQLYQAFASAEETTTMRAAFAEGIGWGDAKAKLFERIDAEVAPLREKYEALIAKPADIESILRDGAARLRARYATSFIASLREAVGLRDLSTAAVSESKSAAKKDATLPVFKQYREADGKFYFKLAQGERLLLQSAGFDSPRDAGQCIALLKSGHYDASDPQLLRAEGVDEDEVQAALALLAESEAGKP